MGIVCGKEEKEIGRQELARNVRDGHADGCYISKLGLSTQSERKREKGFQNKCLSKKKLAQIEEDAP